MISEIAKKTARYFAELNVIDQKRTEVYSYGFELLISELISTSVMLIIAVITKNFLQTAAYIAAFTVMRECAGGYHAKTHRNCILAFTASYLAFIAIISFLPKAHYAALLFTGLGLNLIFIYLCAPVDNKNKPFSEEEKRRFRFRSRLAGVIITVIAVFLWLADIKDGLYAVCIMIGILTAGSSVVIGSLQHNREKRERHM